MKRHVTAIILIFTVLGSVAAMAVEPGKFIEFTGSTKGSVIFDGATHKNAGLTCADCHNPEIFTKTKQGTVKITMSDLTAGKYCGRCHNGQKGFMIKGNCSRCHFQAGA